METWKKEKNLEWLNKIKGTLKEGGVWAWPDTGYMFVLTNGKFIGESEEADEALKAILPDKK